MANKTAFKIKGLRARTSLSKGRPNIRKNNFLIIGALLTLTTSITSWADCQSVPNRTINIPPFELTIDPSNNVGDLLHSRLITTGFTEPYCDSPQTVNLELGSFNKLSPLGNGIYNTNIQGIGIKLTYLLTGGSRIFPSRFYYSPLPKNDLISMHLYKTSTTTEEGNLTRGTVGTISTGGITFQTINLNSGIVSNSSCRVLQPTNVRLGTFRDVNFRGGVGSTTPTTDFKLDLKCNTLAAVNLQLDGVAATGSPPGTIALTPSTDTATGVGVQIVYKGDPVTLGTQFNVRGRNESFDFSIPLSAHYYKTANTITPGNANASVTFTLTYE